MSEANVLNDITNGVMLAITFTSSSNCLLS